MSLTSEREAIFHALYASAAAAERANAQTAADRERWVATARALGATAADCAAYDAALIRYAQTQPIPTAAYWAQGWAVGLDQLKRGEPFPTVPDGIAQIALAEALGVPLNAPIDPAAALGAARAMTAFAARLRGEARRAPAQTERVRRGRRG